MMASALGFSLMTVMVKLASARVPVVEIVFARALVSLLLSYGALRRSGMAPLGQRRGLLLLRGLLGFCGLSCVFYSVTHLPLAEATVLQYLHPTFTAGLAIFLLGERPGLRVLLAGLVSLIGVVLVARPAPLFGGAGPLDPFAVGIAIGGALFSALAYVTVRALGRSEDPLVIVLYFPMVTVPATLPFVLIEGVIPVGLDWLWLLGAGLAAQLGQVCMTHGLRHLPAAQGTAISYSQVAFAASWGILFFDEVPGAYTLLGTILILGSTFYASRPAP